MTNYEMVFEMHLKTRTYSHDLCHAHFIYLENASCYTMSNEESNGSHGFKIGKNAGRTDVTYFKVLSMYLDAQSKTMKHMTENAPHLLN
jgi:hypothetical protein